VRAAAAHEPAVWIPAYAGMSGKYFDHTWWANRETVLASDRVRDALLNCSGHARVPGNARSSVGPVLLKPTQNFFQVARLCLTP
jgi:hypothetical protein